MRGLTVGMQSTSPRAHVAAITTGVALSTSIGVSLRTVKKNLIVFRASSRSSESHKHFRHLTNSGDRGTALLSNKLSVCSKWHLARMRNAVRVSFATFSREISLTASTNFSTKLSSLLSKAEPLAESTPFSSSAPPRAASISTSSSKVSRCSTSDIKSSIDIIVETRPLRSLRALSLSSMCRVSRRLRISVMSLISWAGRGSSGLPRT
mmetsp:Transcript_24197/g.47556  ORF Transcript_24197/g.47556 Transcript_24197/m.47556 type:complete len:208 (+) Transcript_24197:1301-1924(+)